jgi:NAD/NADP transhydrogenase beta subunit
MIIIDKMTIRSFVEKGILYLIARTIFIATKKETTTLMILIRGEIIGITATTIVITATIAKRMIASFVVNLLKSIVVSPFFDKII